MLENNITYSVVLRSGISPEEREFYGLWARKITHHEFAEGLLFFPCVEIDTSHHVYIEMKVLSKDSSYLITLQIPHNFVLSIDGSPEKHTIGFHNSSP